MPTQPTTTHDESSDYSGLASLLVRQQLTITCIRGFAGSARRRVVEWLVDLVKEEGENMDIVALTVTIIDMMSMKVKKSQLQLLAGAALLVATKARDRRLRLDRIVFFMDHAGNRETLLVWEKLILLKIKFNISVVVPHDFLSIFFSLFSHFLPSPLSYVSFCCSQLLSLSCMEQKLSTSLPSLQATAAIYLTLETEDIRKTFLTVVEKTLHLEKDDILCCVRLLENVLIRTMPEERGDHTYVTDMKNRNKNDKKVQAANTQMMRRSHKLLTPQKSEFVLGQISINSSTPRKSSSELKFPCESSENKENDDSAIALNTSLLDTLCLSSPPSSSSSRHSSTKSSPDSGASVSSYSYRLARL